jgi:hypothetical protein
MKIGDLVRYAGSNSNELLGLVTKESRVRTMDFPHQTIECYVVWVNMDDEGWWNKDLLKKVTNENR